MWIVFCAFALVSVLGNGLNEKGHNGNGLNENVANTLDENGLNVTESVSAGETIASKVEDYITGFFQILQLFYVAIEVVCMIAIKQIRSFYILSPMDVVTVD